MVILSFNNLCFSETNTHLKKEVEKKKSKNYTSRISIQARHDLYKIGKSKVERKRRKLTLIPNSVATAPPKE